MSGFVGLAAVKIGEPAPGFAAQVVEFLTQLGDQPALAILQVFREALLPILDGAAQAGHGRAVVIVSSDLPELLSISDRIAIMRRGRIVDIVPAADATEQSLMREFLGVADA